MFVFKDLVPPSESVEFITALEEALEWLYYDIYIGRVYMDHDAFWPEAADILVSVTKRFWKSVDDSELSLSTKNHVAALMLTISRRALMDVYDERSDRCTRDTYPPSSVVDAIKPLPGLIEIPHSLMVLVKMREGSLKDFSDKELRRVFRHLSGPAACLRSAKAMIVSGNLKSVHDIPQLIGYGKPLYTTPAVMTAIWE